MHDNRARASCYFLVDLVLLIAALGAGFVWLKAERPAGVMIGAAVVVYLLICGRGGATGWRALGAVLVCTSIFAFFWGRAMDGAWLLVWHALALFWRRAPSWWSRAFRLAASVCGHLRLTIGNLLRLPVAKRSLAVARVLAVLVGAGWLISPYLVGGLFGAGDTYWYATVVADFVVQVRAGVFPPWLGQSDYAFYGGSFPLRFAPYLQHLGAVIDLATLRMLPPYAIVNVAVAGSFLASVIVMMVCLRRLAPDRPWMVAGAAWLYACCPAIVGIAYAQDLYMSVSALPFLPLAITGAVRLLESDDWRNRLLIAGSLAAAWLAHPPLALWVALVVLALQIPRLARLRSWRATWRGDLATVGILILLSGYSIVSILTLGPRPAVVAPFVNHVQFIVSTFPRNWLPLPLIPRGLESLQIGYGIAALGILFIGTWRAGIPIAGRWLWGIGLVLVLLLTPVPGLLPLLWRAIPQPILNLTDIWPMQRLMPVAALCFLFAFVIAWSAVAWARWQRWACGMMMIGAVAWGAMESLKFHRHVSKRAPGWERTEQLFRPENRVMTRETMTQQMVVPRYFNNGVSDPELEHRLLDPRSHEVVRAAADGIGRGDASKQAFAGMLIGRLEPGEKSLELSPTIRLEAGRRYLLRCDFLWPAEDYAGTLLIEGGEFRRLHQMPESGGARAFGAGPQSARWVVLWNTSGKRDDLRLRWVPASAASPRLKEGESFARVELWEFTQEQLPVKVRSWTPYRASVRLESEAFLETPRLFVPGYQAMVDGQKTPVEQSPDGLVMVKLRPGEHLVELNYQPALATRVAYFGSTAVWLGFVAWLGWRWMRQLWRNGLARGARA